MASALLCYNKKWTGACPCGARRFTLNARLLAEALAQEGGGRSRVFSDRPSGLWGSAVEGGGPMAIYGPDGVQTAALDAGALEHQVSALRSEVTAALARLRGRGRGRGGRGRGRGRSRGGPWQGAGQQEEEEPKN